ncbi:MAG: OTU domain-containing protein [Myxococcota bacterium]
MNKIVFAFLVLIASLNSFAVTAEEVNQRYSLLKNLYPNGNCPANELEALYSLYRDYLFSLKPIKMPHILQMGQRLSRLAQGNPSRADEFVSRFTREHEARSLAARARSVRFVESSMAATANRPLMQSMAPGFFLSFDSQTSPDQRWNVLLNAHKSISKSKAAKNVLRRRVLAKVLHTIADSEFRTQQALELDPSNGSASEIAEHLINWLGEIFAELRSQKKYTEDTENIDALKTAYQLWSTISHYAAVTGNQGLLEGLKLIRLTFEESAGAQQRIGRAQSHCMARAGSVVGSRQGSTVPGMTPMQIVARGAYVLDQSNQPSGSRARGQERTEVEDEVIDSARESISAIRTAQIGGEIFDVVSNWVADDGDCAYHSLNISRADFLRQVMNIMDFQTPSSQTLARVFTGNGVNYNNWVHSMANGPNLYASELELTLWAHLNQTQVHVLTIQGGIFVGNTENVFGPANAANHVYLGYVNTRISDVANHYIRLHLTRRRNVLNVPAQESSNPNHPRPRRDDDDENDRGGAGTSGRTRPPLGRRVNDAKPASGGEERDPKEHRTEGQRRATGANDYASALKEIAIPASVKTLVGRTRLLNRFTAPASF